MEGEGGWVGEKKYRKRTRNVSPIIHEGAELPEGSTKKAPRQLSFSLVSRKSVWSIVQFVPPKDIWSVTFVLQAKKKKIRGRGGVWA